MSIQHRAKQRSIPISGLGGDEAFCLNLKGFKPGHLLVGNSVQSIGVLGNFSAGIRNLVGGESSNITASIKNGRDAALSRIITEGQQLGASGITGISSELRSFGGQIEFLSTGSAIHTTQTTPKHFTSSFNGQELFCAMDAGYIPRKFSFGNIAYSIGVSQGLWGSLKTLAKGEIKEFSNVLNATRHKVLERISQDALRSGANCVLGIEVNLQPFGGFHEMLMTGTACQHTNMPLTSVATSDLMSDELWSMTQMGYAPIKVVMGTAVYSLGVVGGIAAAWRGLIRGEIPGLTHMVYDAREHALDLLEAEARQCGADLVMGTDVYIHEMGSGLLEFMAIGTAMRKDPLAKVISSSLPTQALGVHRRTFRNAADDFLSGLNVKG